MSKTMDSTTLSSEKRAFLLSFFFSCVSSLTRILFDVLVLFSGIFYTHFGSNDETAAREDI